MTVEELRILYQQEKNQYWQDGYTEFKCDAKYSFDYSEWLEEKLIQACPLDLRSDFLNELQALLKKYDVELIAKDHWQGYAECGEDVRITAEFNDYKIKDIDFGWWISKDEHGGKL
jgi:hypothetical protein